MPEGDTIHNYAAVIGRHLAGRRLVGGRVVRPDATLSGMRVTEVAADGKHLYIAFDDDLVLRTHLGMHGGWHGYAPGEAWQRRATLARAVLTTSERVIVCFAPKEIELITARGRLRRAMDPTRSGADLMAQPEPAPLVARARALLDPRTGIAEVLLDQRIAAGVGNVYKCEVLFLAGIHPLTPLAALSDHTLRGLLDRAGKLLLVNRGRRRRRTRQASGAGLWVYGRAGQACLECGSTIRRTVTGPHRRGTWWCPTCQTL